MTALTAITDEDIDRQLVRTAFILWGDSPVKLAKASRVCSLMSEIIYNEAEADDGQ